MNEKQKQIAELARMADRVFRLVEADQGWGFVSDDLCAVETKEQFFKTLRAHLFYTRRAARKLEKYLKEHGEAHKPTKAKCTNPTALSYPKETL